LLRFSCKSSAWGGSLPSDSGSSVFIRRR
jgi:hypothetical protein